MKYNFELFRKNAALMNLHITSEMEEKFSFYYDLMTEWNQVMNLTAVTDFEEVIEKHFLDSISLGCYYNLEQEYRVIDIGSGAGFPGIPLKIVFPKLKMVLADSTSKKVKFLDAVINQLDLKEISAVHARAEDLAKDLDYREKFDLCVSRAVSNLASLSEYCLPFVKNGGKFISYKAGEIEQETESAKAAVHILGGRLDAIKKFQLPGTDYHRSFVFIDKVKSTSKKYPRKAGVPAKMPLGTASVSCCGHKKN